MLVSVLETLLLEGAIVVDDIVCWFVAALEVRNLALVKPLVNLDRPLATLGCCPSSPPVTLVDELLALESAVFDDDVDSARGVNLLLPGNSCLLDFLVVDMIGLRVVELNAAGGGVVVVVDVVLA